MNEPLSKNLGRRRYVHHTDASQPASTAKRSRVNESQNNQPPSILNLRQNFLLPPPAPIAKSSANPFVTIQNANDHEPLEESDSETDFFKSFARVSV